MRVTWADLYCKPYLPRCPLHGEMKPREGSVSGYTSTIWACPGFDGEGCDAEDTWTYAGKTEGMTWTAPA